jgi:restriction endonuclease S subunit
MKKYDNYKDSGIKWLGEIPKHWSVTKLKFIGDAIGGLTYAPNNVVEDETKGILVLRSSNIQNGKLSLLDNVYVNLDISEKLTLKMGDILICSRNGSQHLIGKNICIDERNEGNTFGAFMMIFRSSNYQFLNHFFNSPIFTSQSGLFLTATINQLTSGTLNNFYIAIPDSLQEQTAIANYLDQKTTQIDQLINQKKRFIELLQEERTAVINQAVTKGLDPTVKMKDSGIEWLGEIPEHWAVKRLKYLVSEPLKYGANEPAEEEIIEDPRYIRITDFGNDGKLKKNTFKSLPMNKAANYLLSNGDILFARSGSTVGKTFLFKNYDGFACFAGYLIKATSNPDIIVYDFLYNFTNSSGYNNWKESIFQQSTIQNIGADKYNQLKIAIPPIKEQKIIIEFIAKKIGEIETIISKSQQEIVLLKEYKIALISEVVTGKVDVRDVVLN